MKKRKTIKNVSPNSRTLRKAIWNHINQKNKTSWSNYILSTALTLCTMVQAWYISKQGQTIEGFEKLLKLSYSQDTSIERLLTVTNKELQLLTEGNNDRKEMIELENTRSYIDIVSTYNKIVSVEMLKKISFISDIRGDYLIEIVFELEEILQRQLNNRYLLNNLKMKDLWMNFYYKIKSFHSDYLLYGYKQNKTLEEENRINERVNELKKDYELFVNVVGKQISIDESKFKVVVDKKGIRNIKFHN